jgi:hypothetical protein
MSCEIRAGEIANVVRDNNRGSGNCGLNELVVPFVEGIRTPTEMKLSLVRQGNELKDQVRVLAGGQAGQTSNVWSPQNVRALRDDRFGQHERDSPFKYRQ